MSNRHKPDRRPYPERSRAVQEEMSRRTYRDIRPHLPTTSWVLRNEAKRLAESASVLEVLAGEWGSRAESLTLRLFAGWLQVAAQWLEKAA